MALKTGTLLEYRRQNVCAIALLGGNGIATDRMLNIVEGINIVSNKDAEQIKQHPQIKMLINKGVIVFHSEISLETDYRELSISDGAEVVPSSLIALTFDLSILERWELFDSRPIVLEAIKNQRLEIAKVRDSIAPNK